MPVDPWRGVWWGTSTALQQLVGRASLLGTSRGAVREQQEECFVIFHELSEQLDHEPRSLAILGKVDIALRMLTAAGRKTNRIGIRVAEDSGSSPLEVV
jgi:hypothetical protein